jgi:hypothetical protein
MMGMLDGLLGQITGNLDVAGLAAKVGLSPAQVESGMAALGKAHAEPGDTVADASAATGLPTDKLQDLVGQMGGEGALGKLSSMLGGGAAGGGIMGMLDRDGDGNPLNDVTGMLGGLLGKK